MNQKFEWIYPNEPFNEKDWIKKSVISLGSWTTIRECKMRDFIFVSKEFRLNEQISESSCGDLLSSSLLSIKNSKEEKKNNALEPFMKEIDALKRLNGCKNFVSYFGFHVDMGKGLANIFMEYLPLSLYQRIQSKAAENVYFDLEEIKFVGIEILRGLEAAHKIGVVHRDIKSKNILIELDSSQKIITVKICDLGSSCSVGKPSRSGVGTVRWSSPELLEANLKKKSIEDCSLDIWSFGMIIIEMLSLKIPYSKVNLFDVKQHIMSGNMPDKNGILEAYNSIWRLIENDCLQRNPSFRKLPSEIIQHFSKLESM